MYEYKTNGTCSTKISFDIIDGELHSVIFEGGCDGNSKAIAALVEGADAAETANKLKGIECKSKCSCTPAAGTSCADQFARAIEKFL